MQDLFLVAGDEVYFGLGSSFPVHLYEMKSAVAEVAIDAGLADAARIMAKLPIDSSSWTGLSKSFKFDAMAKEKVTALVQKARTELQRSSLSNAEHSKADAYLDCVLLLAEQEDPDVDLITVLLRKALFFLTGVGLLADFKSIFGN